MRRVDEDGIAHALRAAGSPPLTTRRSRPPTRPPTRTPTKPVSEEGGRSGFCRTRSGKAISERLSRRSCATTLHGPRTGSDTERLAATSPPNEPFTVSVAAEREEGYRGHSTRASRCWPTTTRARSSEPRWPSAARLASRPARSCPPASGSSASTDSAIPTVPIGGHPNRHRHGCPATRTLWYVASTQMEGYSSLTWRVRNGSTTVWSSWHIRDTGDFEIPSSPSALTGSSTFRVDTPWRYRGTHHPITVQAACRFPRPLSDKHAQPAQLVRGLSMAGDGKRDRES